MSIGRLAFVPVPGDAGRRTAFRILVDEREYVTACFLADDLANLTARFSEMADEGRRFDLFFSNAGPFSVSVCFRGGEPYLHLSDSFDGGVLEDRVLFETLKGALVELVQAVLGFPGIDERMRHELARGLPALSEWSGPVRGS